ncbi:transposase [Gluconobacter japonicus]|uniref:transposase n=1 Tax=Gluconobacter japonicus TaxID=376620 RepID=UPI003D2A2F7F
MNVVTAAPRLERAGKTPSQKAILWLLREHGRVRHERGSREFRWRMVDGVVTVLAEPGPWAFLAACGATVVDADGFATLTAAGRAICAGYRVEPRIVAAGRMPDQMTWLTDEQMERVAPCFPLSHGKPRLDDRVVLSAIVHVLRHGLRWSDVPADYGVHCRRLRNRLIHWAQLGVMDQVLAQLMDRRDGVLRLVLNERLILSHPTGALLAARGLFPFMAPVEEEMSCAA